MCIWKGTDYKHLKFAATTKESQWPKDGYIFIQHFFNLGPTQAEKVWNSLYHIEENSMPCHLHNTVSAVIPNGLISLWRMIVLSFYTYSLCGIFKLAAEQNIFMFKLWFLYTEKDRQNY